MPEETACRGRQIAIGVVGTCLILAFGLYMTALIEVVILVLIPFWILHATGPLRLPSFSSTPTAAGVLLFCVIVPLWVWAMLVILRLSAGLFVCTFWFAAALYRAGAFLLQRAGIEIRQAPPANPKPNGM